MTIKSILECERKNVHRLLKFQLPHRFKKIGWIVVITMLVALVLFKLLVSDLALQGILKDIAKYLLLVSLLIVSLSKERIEDEFIKSIRMQSYMFACIFGVLTALVFPFINYSAETLVDGNSELQGVSDFLIIWTLLLTQIFYFNVLKKLSND